MQRQIVRLGGEPVCQLKAITDADAKRLRPTRQVSVVISAPVAEAAHLPVRRQHGQNDDIGREVFLFAYGLLDAEGAGGKAEAAIAHGQHLPPQNAGIEDIFAPSLQFFRRGEGGSLRAHGAVQQYIPRPAKLLQRQKVCTDGRIADFAGGFLHAGTPAHAIHYFSMVNLKGAIISLTIGLLVYLFVIRTRLMRTENGVRVYVDCWPKGWDIEERIYRPAVGALLEGCGKLMALGAEPVLEDKVFRPCLRVLSFAGAVVCKALSELPDTLALIFARTVLRMKHYYAEGVHVGNTLTDTVGHAADGLAEAVNHTLRRSHPKAHHYTGAVAGQTVMHLHMHVLGGKPLGEGLIPA